MSRVTLTAVAVLGLVLAGGGTSIAEEPKAQANYFATTVGDHLVFEITAGATRSECVTEVTGASAKAGVVIVETRWTVAGQADTTTTHEVSDRGVAKVAEDGQFLRSGQWVLRLPCKKGDTWTVPVTLPRGNPAPGRPPEFVTLDTTAAVRGEEDVEVPAGKFRALRVERAYPVGGRTQRITYWVAPGLGTVRQTVESGEASALLLKTDMEMALKSFTPGKKKD